MGIYTHDTPPTGDATCSYCEAEARRIRQQQDPAHDQGAFHLVQLPPSGRTEAPQAVIKIAGQEVATIVSLNVESNDESLLAQTADFGFTEVTGSITAYYDDAELYAAFVNAEPNWNSDFDPTPLWQQNLMWAIHNLIAHPISEITYWLGFIWRPIRTWGENLHDNTVPKHAPNTGRG